MDLDRIREMLIDGWGPLFKDASIQPLHQGDVITHTARLLLVGLPGSGGRFAAKVNRSAAFQRIAPFERVKFDVMQHCKSRGASLQTIETTLSGNPVHARGETVIELSRFEGGQPPRFDAASVEAMVDAGLSLRRALDTTPDSLQEQLSRIPPLSLVDEPDPSRALDQGRSLLAEFRGSDDPWCVLACRYLGPLFSIRGRGEELFARDCDEAGRARVIHGDLHRSHFLLSTTSERDVPVVIDFDNITVGDPALDFAWICDQAAAAAVPPGTDVALLDLAIERLLASGRVHAADLARGVAQLVAYAIPILVDIAKDILVRDDRRELWRHYLDIVDVERKLAVLGQLKQK